MIRISTRSLYPRSQSHGRCEVIAFSDDLAATFSTLCPERVRVVVEAWVTRTDALNTMPEVEQVFCFENRGSEIGVTPSHPHGQIYAYRVVASNEHWTAFVPAAARWPFEIHLYSHRHVPDLPASTDEERKSLVQIYLELLQRLDGVYGGAMPYVAAWHQVPAKADRELACLHLGLFSILRVPGKVKALAGSESGMGMFINDIAPECAAGMLRSSRL